jgi:hypothetical protein
VLSIQRQLNKATIRAFLRDHRVLRASFSFSVSDLTSFDKMTCTREAHLPGPSNGLLFSRLSPNCCFLGQQLCWEHEYVHQSLASPGQEEASSLPPALPDSRLPRPSSRSSSGETAHFTNPSAHVYARGAPFVWNPTSLLFEDCFPTLASDASLSQRLSRAPSVAAIGLCQSFKAL